MGKIGGISKPNSLCADRFQIQCSSIEYLSVLVIYICKIITVYIFMQVYIHKTSTFFKILFKLMEKNPAKFEFGFDQKY